ncbi:ankyrin repeat domain-containing protein 50-like [Gigantopelta aegis]|uniref:ankyrin repeat domain-containing protein 50-like n=1 Tax=Gigantopelta aegis TaxID=1735272 RepID=UPI001B887777|nr:ankyrin repeat domain-containing protein 50-like [Gigantopelta aegis]
MGQANSRQEAFWEACAYGRIHLVRKFIEEGIDVDYVSYTQDCCPIHVSTSRRGSIKLNISLTVNSTSDIVSITLNISQSTSDIRNNTALHHAAMKGHADIMDMLLKAGSDVNAQEKNGWTALHNACYWCHPKAVKVLLRHSCDINLKNKDHRTALHETARSKEEDERKLAEIVRDLIAAGADVNAKGCDLGETDFSSLMFSAYHGHPDVAMALIEARCDLNARGSSNWWTSLHWAADRGKDELVYILLEAGADPTKKGMRGELASDRATNPTIKEDLMNAVNMFRELEVLERSAAKVALKNTSAFSSEKSSATTSPGHKSSSLSGASPSSSEPYSWSPSPSSKDDLSGSDISGFYSDRRVSEIEQTENSTLTEATWYSVSEAERTHSPCSEMSCDEGAPHVPGTKRSSTPVADTKDDSLPTEESKPKNTEVVLVKTSEHKALWENNVVVKSGEFQVIPEEEGSNFEKESESSVEKDLESGVEKDLESSEGLIKGSNSGEDLKQKDGCNVNEKDSNIVETEEIH